MRVVVDTNVLVSAILKDRVPEDVLLFIINTPDFEWIASEDILTEYKEVLSRRKFKFSGSPVSGGKFITTKGHKGSRRRIRTDVLPLCPFVSFVVEKRFPLKTVEPKF